MVAAITLREVTSANWAECAKLTVKEDQTRFVASNVWSLAQSNFFPGCIPMAIYADEVMVGFLMYELKDQICDLFRLMIDGRYQQRGYGRAALREFIGTMKEGSRCRTIEICYLPDNDTGGGLYRSLGFADTGRIEEGEIIVALNIG